MYCHVCNSHATHQVHPVEGQGGPRTHVAWYYCAAHLARLDLRGYRSARMATAGGSDSS